MLIPRKDLSEYRASTSEQQRTADLLRLMPETGRDALDIGARDGHFSLLMAARFERVVALDLTKPTILHPRVECVQEDAGAMRFGDNSFDFILCAEVLEHIPMSRLPRICQEIVRVANDRILIGVPYKQDIRVGRTTCYSCGERNPPWGHVTSFNERCLKELFGTCSVQGISYVGRNRARTNVLAAALMDFAGNPYGPYDQEEPCIHCGSSLLPPPRRTVAQRIATKVATWSRSTTGIFAKTRGNWMHVSLRKESSCAR